MSAQCKILVVDDDRRMAQTLVDILNSNGYQADEVHSVEDAERRMQEITFDCVLSDIRMPYQNGVDLVRTISNNQPGTPVILMTAYASDGLVRDGLTEGVAAVITKPLNIRQLLSFLARVCQDICIVVIDDNDRYCRSMRDIMESHGFTIQTYQNIESFNMSQLDERETILLLDMKLDGMSGLDVLLQVRSEHPDMPVILITGHAEEMAEEIAQSLENSAHTCLVKPVKIPELLGVIKDVRIKDSKRILEDVSYLSDGET